MRVILTCIFICTILVSHVLANGQTGDANIDHNCAERPIAHGVVSALHSALGFTLKSSNQVYFLDGLRLQTGKPYLSIGQKLELFSSPNHTDRYGRIPVFAFSGQKLIQVKLLEFGEAVIFGTELTNKCLNILRQAEKQAETGKRGYWKTKNGVILAKNLPLLSKISGKFAIIQGKIASVGDRSRRLYLNFGQNWSQDFTVSVVKSGSGAFKGNVARLGGLGNRTVRVRGNVEQRQGPLIRLFDESQIEILD